MGRAGDRQNGPEELIRLAPCAVADEGRLIRRRGLREYDLPARVASTRHGWISPVHTSTQYSSPTSRNPVLDASRRWQYVEACAQVPFRPEATRAPVTVGAALQASSSGRNADERVEQMDAGPPRRNQAPAAGRAAWSRGSTGTAPSPRPVQSQSQTGVEPPVHRDHHRRAAFETKAANARASSMPVPSGFSTQMGTPRSMNVRATPTVAGIGMTSTAASGRPHRASPRRT